MANYNALIRSNYFKVKNLNQYKKMCEKFDLDVIEKEINGETMHGFLREGSDGGIPTRDPETGEEIVFVRILSRHLQNSNVAIIQEIGYEKMRFLNGFAVAVNSRGQTKAVSIHDIHEQARELGEKLTPCEY